MYNEFKEWIKTIYSNAKSYFRKYYDKIPKENRRGLFEGIVWMAGIFLFTLIVSNALSTTPEKDTLTAKVPTPDPIRDNVAKSTDLSKSTSQVSTADMSGTFIPIPVADPPKIPTPIASNTSKPTSSSVKRTEAQAEAAKKKAIRNMYSKVRKDAEAKGERIPITVDNSRVYCRVMNYDNNKVMVRFPFTYGSADKTVHSYLFSIDYNGNVIEVLDKN